MLTTTETFSAAPLSGERMDCSLNLVEVLQPIMESSPGDVTCPTKQLAKRQRAADQAIYNLGYLLKAKFRCTSCG